MSQKEKKGPRHKARRKRSPSVNNFSAPAEHISVLELSPDEFVLELPPGPQLYQVWTDASYNDGSRIGGAAVITGNSTGVAGVENILIFNLSRMDLHGSDDAEIMTAIMAFRALPEGRIEKLITDSSSLANLFNAVRNVTLPRDHSQNYLKLYDFLQQSMTKHPGTVVEWSPRNTSYLRIADSFAYAAAYSSANITALKYFPEAKPHLIEMERQIVIWPPRSPNLAR